MEVVEASVDVGFQERQWQIVADRRGAQDEALTLDRQQFAAIVESASGDSGG